MAVNILQDILKLFVEQRELPSDLTVLFFDTLLAEVDEAVIANILTAWETKGTTESELFEMASIMRSRCLRVASKHDVFVDAVGTGGSRAKTFNVSTAAAFVIAGAGIPVAKHGNRAASSNSGSADVLAELGVNPAVDAVLATKCLDEIGICFMFAPNFHRLSPVLAKVRRGLGFPTIFNNLGPLCNPANAPHQIIGVWHKDMVQKTANVLAKLGTRKSWVVHGSDGLDEITLNGKTFVAEIENGVVRRFDLSPLEMNIAESEIYSLRRTSPGESAELVKSILNNSCTITAARDLVLINAAAAIFIAGSAENLGQARDIAAESLDTGKAFNKLEMLAAATI